MSPVEWEDLLDLAERLAKERSFLACEQKQLRHLNEKLRRNSSKLAQRTWLASQLRASFQRPIAQGSNPALCCHQLNSLENVSFVDARKRLGFVEVQNYGGFLHGLRQAPQLLAACLASAEKQGPLPSGLAHTLLGGVYGGCVFAEDEHLLLHLLRHLIAHQVVAHPEPSRMLRPGACIFSRLYCAWNESLFAGKVFLTGALHQPVLHVLSEDDAYWDADPAKALLRFTPEETMRKFGQSGTAEFEDAVKKHLEEMVCRLCSAVNRFIDGIHNNMFLFPQPIKWVVKQLHVLLTESRKLDARQVSMMCTDLVFGSFICPVIVNPEVYGITELFMSDVAQFNLMQVAQIVQRLAMWQWQEADAKVSETFAQFDKSCLTFVMEEILEGSDNLIEDDDATKPGNLSALSRTGVVISEPELHNLVSVLRLVSTSGSEDVDMKALSNLLAHLPSKNLNAMGKPNRLSCQNTSMMQLSPPNTPHKNDKGRLKVGRSVSAPSEEAMAADEKMTNSVDGTLEEVLVIPFGFDNLEYVGLLPESKFLEDNGIDMALCLDAQVAQVHTQEKRTRFSLSHDDGSIVSAGNVSDNLEAVSEAASNHSGASSLDIEEDEEGEEDQQDNLSDMVSANVSGRGTPSISGRDTPSSQVTESEEAASVNQVQQRAMPENNRPSAQLGELPDPPVAPPAMPPPKQHSRTDIDDKFGKFEIKKLIEGDETFSLVSDTWSTDVLASDSETVEHSSEHNFPVGNHMMQQTPRPGEHANPNSAMLDMSETASEAWSTDVMASDSERLGEVDTDDAGSVARSDDVCRSEADGDRDNRDTPPLASAMAFRPIRVELPVLRESPMPVVVAPKVSLQSLGQQVHRSAAELFLPPSPPSSVSAASGGAEGRDEPDSKPRPKGAKSDRAYDGAGSLDVETRASPVPRLSTTSLASSSSSSMGGGSDLRAQSNTPVLQENCVELKADSAAEGKHNGAIPSSSTGAIPKSISFDKTAERGDKDVDDEPRNKRGSFFRNIKLPFKSRGRKSTRPGHEDNRISTESSDFVPRSRRKGDEMVLDSEEILAKYRRKPGSQASCLRQDSKEGRENGVDEDEADDRQLHIDPLHPELSEAFVDAKRKLRLVLCNVDTEGVARNVLQKRIKRGRASEKLVMLLKMLLNEAINVQNESSIAQVHEALRCVNLFDDAGCRKLIQSLKEDYFKRAPFIAYITRSKSGLLSTQNAIKRLLERNDNERRMCVRHLVRMSVQRYLKLRDEMLRDFESSFQQLQMPDEKTELLYNYLEGVIAEMERDPLWANLAKEEQTKLEIARQIVEQTVISRVYLNALYPNGEGDLSRDQVLHEHMNHLAQIITLNHKDLRIPKSFQYECPWPSAQAKIVVLGACKTPRDKLRCVVDCAKTIMSLLEMGHNRSAPAADDFTPVLVFVLIKANPPSLLSTVQYVNNYYGSQLSGEEEYWWVQFCSAIEYIKTID